MKLGRRDPDMGRQPNENAHFTEGIYHGKSTLDFQICLETRFRKFAFLELEPRNQNPKPKTESLEPETQNPSPRLEIGVPSGLEQADAKKGQRIGFGHRPNRLYKEFIAQLSSFRTQKKRGPTRNSNPRSRIH